MFKQPLTLTDILLIVTNLIPLYGVWYEGWDAKKIFTVYCLETVIVGIFYILKMIITVIYKKNKADADPKERILAGGIFIILFFIVHYGFFVFVQTQIFFFVTGFFNKSGWVQHYSDIFLSLGREGRILLLSFFCYYSIQLITDFLWNSTYKTIEMKDLMMQPYVRIFIQQFVVIIGAFFLMFNWGRIFILIFVVVKISFESFMNRSNTFTKKFTNSTT